MDCGAAGLRKQGHVGVDVAGVHFAAPFRSRAGWPGVRHLKGPYRWEGRVDLRNDNVGEGSVRITLNLGGRYGRPTLYAERMRP